MPNRAARPANCIRTGAPPVANLEHDAVCRTSSPHQNVMVTCSPSTDDVSSAQQPPAPSTTLSASAPIGFELKPTLSNVHGCSTSPALVSVAAVGWLVVGGWWLVLGSPWLVIRGWWLVVSASYGVLHTLTAHSTRPSGHSRQRCTVVRVASSTCGARGKTNRPSTPSKQAMCMRSWCHPQCQWRQQDG